MTRPQRPSSGRRLQSRAWGTGGRQHRTTRPNDESPEAPTRTYRTSWPAATSRGGRHFGDALDCLVLGVRGFVVWDANANESAGARPARAGWLDVPAKGCPDARARTRRFARLGRLGALSP